MQRTNINELRQKIGEQVLVNAWVEVRRDQGKMIFMDLRDRSGMVQSVVLPMHKEALTVAQQIRSEWVLAITAQVNKRPDKNIKQDVPNGDIELEVLSIEVLNQSTTPPFDISGDGKEVNEEVRMKYRYIDLRRQRLQRNIRLRHEIMLLIRQYLSELDFLEIETPILKIGRAHV